MIRRAAVPAALTFLLPILVTAGLSTSTAAPAAPQSAATRAPSNLGKLAASAVTKVDWKTRARYAPAHTTPQWGPSFNNPTQGTTGAALEVLTPAVTRIGSRKVNAAGMAALRIMRGTPGKGQMVQTC